MKRLILALNIIWMLVGCRTDRSIDSALDDAQKLMLTRPDSALTILQNINPKENFKKRTAARYSLLYSQALDKNWIDVGEDSLIKCAIEYYSSHGKDIDKANANYYRGIVYYNACDVDKAMESFVKARIYAEKTDNNLLKGLIYNVIGNLYLDQCSFEEAISMFSNAAQSFSEAGNKRNRLLAVHSKGLAEAYLNRKEDALESFNEALNFAMEQADTTTFLDIISSMGSLNAITSTDTTSLQSIKFKLLQIYSQYTKGEIPLEHYPILGNIYYKENQIDSARIFFKDYLNSDPLITESNRGLFAILSAIEEQSHNYKEALTYEKMFSFYTDSISTKQKEILIQNLEKKYKTEYYQKSYNILQTKNMYEIIIFILVFLIFVFLVGIAFITFLRAIHDRNEQIAEYKSYAAEVQTHYTDLQNELNRASKTVHNEKSQALFSILRNRVLSLQSMLEMASKYENDSDAFYKNFRDHIRVISGKDKKLTEDVIDLANLSCNGIIKHLEQLYPQLTQRELSYCGFVCLGFTQESIRILYNHTNIYSIYTMRSKIRSKMGLTNSSSNLETFILEMMKISKVHE